MSGLNLQPSILGKFSLAQQRMSVEQMRKTYKTGFRNSKSGLFLYAKKEDKNRLMIVVRKKLYKKAVDRNRVRRVIKEAFRQVDPDKRYWAVVDLKSWSGPLSSNELFNTAKVLFEGSFK